MTVRREVVSVKNKKGEHVMRMTEEEDDFGCSILNRMKEREEIGRLKRRRLELLEVGCYQSIEMSFTIEREIKR